MKALQTLPAEYREIFAVDLQKNKHLAFGVNSGAAVIAAAMGIAMHFHVSIATLFDMSEGFGMYFLRFGILMVGIVTYIFLHELVHGIAMKYYGCKKVKYGFTGLYAYAGCEDYFDKKSYLVIALAPVVFWGIVLAVVNVLVPANFFWVVYIIQICNISGAAGDLYVTAKFAKLPKDILVRDSGVSMAVYSAE